MPAAANLSDAGWRMRKWRGMTCALLAAMMLLSACAPGWGSPTPTTTDTTTETDDNLQKSLIVDVSNLKSNDGQPLLLFNEIKVIPERPNNVDALPQEDPLHWYDLEYAGWNPQKTNIPASPISGAIGKNVIVIINGDHPYLTSYGIGAKKIADAYKMKYRLLSPNWDLNVQNQLVDQAINGKPDLIVLVPLDAKASILQFKKINDAGIPVIASNSVPYQEGFQYVLGWTGPDDWGQMRMLAQELAKKMDFKGGICYLRHAPGGSPYFARTNGVITELIKVAPDIKTLEMQAPGFEVERTTQVVSDWIVKYGDSLNAIVISDDYAQLTGAIDACRKAGREDIILVAAGNSKTGMDAVKAGQCFAITYQSAEADGALAMKMAADWFNGKTIEPVRYLPKQIIKRADVDQYLPAQW